MKQLRTKIPKTIRARIKSNCDMQVFLNRQIAILIPNFYREFRPLRKRRLWAIAPQAAGRKQADACALVYRCTGSRWLAPASRVEGVGLWDRPQA